MRLTRAFLNSGIGGLVAGGALQITDAQDGRDGVGIRLPLPCLEGKIGVRYRVTGHMAITNASDSPLV
jgi:hypothetical protein